jgi:hypothetical protein
LTPSWRTVYSQGAIVIDDVGRDERIGYDICGGEENTRTRTPVCARTLAFAFLDGTLRKGRVPECSPV